MQHKPLKLDDAFIRRLKQEVSQFNEETVNELESIFDTLLAKDPQDRFPILKAYAIDAVTACEANAALFDEQLSSMVNKIISDIQFMRLDLEVIDITIEGATVLLIGGNMLRLFLSLEEIDLPIAYP